MKTRTSGLETACTVNAAYGDPCPAGLPASVGVPFPAGALTDAASLVVKAPSGKQRPATADPLDLPQGRSRRQTLIICTIGT